MSNSHDLVVRWDCVAPLRESAELEDDADLITAMGISRASFSRVMAGKQQPGTRFIAGLCAALGVNPSAITEVVAATAA